MSYITRKTVLYILYNFLVVTEIRSSPTISSNEYRLQSVDTNKAIKNSVYVINSLPKNSHSLHAHCFNKVKDVGFFTLRNSGEYFNWSFVLESGQSEECICGFQVLDIEDTEILYTGELVHYCETKDGYNCVWSVKKDGFYISNTFPPKKLTKIYDADWP
ncbi:hypothetical protein CASFOL_042711 [Castilleja foliolosa]|uniref:S-protein homolog n=1 Tax=Castilleja foliolosa TaxID=1961234 RepID=A0ABD3B7Y5_9LAMI